MASVPNGPLTGGSAGDGNVGTGQPGNLKWQRPVRVCAPIDAIHAA